MKIELNEEQVFFIEKKLKERGLNYLPLQGEMIDHACCMVEEQMQNGQSFETATQVIFEIFGKDELKKLQQQTIFFTHQKSRRMKNIFFAAASVIFLFTTVFFFGTKEKTPLAKSEPLRINQKASLAEAEKTAPIRKNKEEATFVKYLEPPSIKPINEEMKMSSGYGKRYHPVSKESKFHQGIDFVAPLGTPVFATANGEVIIAKYDNLDRRGKYILIKHGDTYQTMYTHLSELNVAAGTKVKKGEIIGKVGSTGASTAPHLHYEVIKNGKRVNPIHYF